VVDEKDWSVFQKSMREDNVESQLCIFGFKKLRFVGSANPQGKEFDLHCSRTEEPSASHAEGIVGALLGSSRSEQESTPEECGIPRSVACREKMAGFLQAQLVLPQLEMEKAFVR
jgi:hypothetical protein